MNQPPHDLPADQRDRLDELDRNLQGVRRRIDDAIKASGRDPGSDGVDLLVVTKTFPASDVRLLAELGVTDVGENRDQEARGKRDEVGPSRVRWHMIGQLQRNKAASVAGWADVVESVDRPELVQALATGAARHGRSALDILIQVNLDPRFGRQSNPGANPGANPGSRGGVLPEDAVDLARVIDQADHLRLAGVMAVAPHPNTGMNPAEAFSALRELAETIRSHWPEARTISAGMSDDLEAAVAHGATQVRIGGAILGERPPVQ